MIVKLIVFGAFIAATAGKECYTALPSGPNSPTFPDTAVKQKCAFDTGVCFKSMTVSTSNFSTDHEKTTTSWAWGCFTEEEAFASLHGGYKCNGGQLEQTQAGIFNGQNVFSYIRVCFCCGDNCNDGSMNDVCNDDPVFTHQCFGAIDLSGSNPKLPDTALEIPCTKTQSCAKVNSYIGATGQQLYEWGCFALPEEDNKCGNKASGQDLLGNYVKVCTCCDDICNDRSMDWITAVDSKCNPDDPDDPPTPPPTGTQCYFSVSENNTTPNLPEQATLVRCPRADDMCFKSHTLVYSNYETETQMESVSYGWGCFSVNDVFVQDIGGYRCGDVYEQSTGSIYEPTGSKWVSYTKLCLCCGKSCNGHDMDKSCMDIDDFTHTCLGAVDSSGKGHDELLPSTAFGIPCTANQACAKLSNTNPFISTQFYQWGCFSMPDKQCGSHSAGFDEYGNYQKVCTCCGDNCNDESMNWIVANDDKCEKTVEPTSPNDDLIPVVAALGALLGVALIVLGAALFYIWRLRQQLNGGSAVSMDKLKIVTNEEGVQ